MIPGNAAHTDCEPSIEKALVEGVHWVAGRL